jgi:hypothetical protein
MNHREARRFAAIAAIGWACCAALAVDPPDLRINPASGLIETVDATWSGSNYNVRYTVVNGAGQQSTSLLLSTNSANDLDPRISISNAGDAVVAWWRDSAPGVLVYRKHAFTAGDWGAERTAGLATENNSRPRLAFAGDKIWVAYQIQYSKSRAIGAQIIDDDPEPFRSIVATTSYTGDLDLTLQFEGGHLWTTWIDTSQRVGYSEYVFQKGQWSVPAYESFGADSTAAARLRIREMLLGY